MPNPEHERVFRRPFDELFTQGALDTLNRLVAPGFVAHGQGGSELVREWLRWYTSAFTERGWAVYDVISEGDKVVARNSGWVTYRGGLLGIPSEGRRVLETGVPILRVKDGLVHELWSETSDLQLVMRLGAFPLLGGEEGGPGS